VKTQFKLLSDLHLEGFSYHYEWTGENVLILAGDIHTRNRHHELINKVPQQVQILMVAGNHEYYNSDFNAVNKYLKSLETTYTNFKFLNNESVTIGHVEIFGGCMFTEFGLYGENEKWFGDAAARRGINDFYIISKDGVTWTTDDHIAEHNKFRRELKAWIGRTEGRTRMVISHFAPHPATCDPKYGNNSINSYFTENMDEFMGWEGYWLFGHTHSPCDLYVGSTHLIANPKGYRIENESFNPDLRIEI
jgi:predicted phosphohydrolase